LDLIGDGRTSKVATKAVPKNEEIRWYEGWPSELICSPREPPLDKAGGRHRRPHKYDCGVSAFQSRSKHFQYIGNHASRIDLAILDCGLSDTGYYHVLLCFWEENQTPLVTARRRSREVMTSSRHQPCALRLFDCSFLGSLDVICGIKVAR